MSEEEVTRVEAEKKEEVDVVIPAANKDSPPPTEDEAKNKLDLTLALGGTEIKLSVFNFNFFIS